jgi:hypothetical protein
MIKTLLALLLFNIIGLAQNLIVYNKSDSGIISDNVNVVYVDKENAKWFGTDKGISVFYDNGKWLSFTAASGLPSDFVTDIIGYTGKADSNFVEVATKGGVARIYTDEEKIKVVTVLQTINSGLVSDSVTCLAINGNSIHWYGTYFGLPTFNGTAWKLFSDLDYLVSNNVTDVVSPENDWTYVTSNGKGVSRVKQDVDGISGASEITTKWHGIASDNVFSVFIDHLGKRWFGTDKGVSSQYGDKPKKNWSTYTSVNGLANNIVNSITEDASGTMWFATCGGVSAYNGKDWKNYTESNGLSGNDVRSVAVDNNGDIWVATNKGVTRIIKEREYFVKKTEVPPIIDGKLNEPQWQQALLTEPFVNPATGSSVKIKTKGKLLWDDNNLYVAFIAYDSDVWGKMTLRDSHLWNEEPVEIFCDPDGDRKNYFEIEINPLGTELDLLMNKAYSEGGSGDFSWDIVELNSAVTVAGTLNNSADTDTAWYCEIAIPFSALNSNITGGVSNPPVAGDMWRLNLARYNRLRDKNGNEIPGGTEISCWNYTAANSFHVPGKFGKIIFSDEIISSVNNKAKQPPEKFELIGNYPNPFNPTTKIAFLINVPGFVSLKVYNTLGQEITTLINRKMQTGYYEFKFTVGEKLTSGVYFVRLKSNGYSDVIKMLLIK